MNRATLEFIRTHADTDVRELALMSSRQVEVDMLAALEQIAGRQAARTKLPSWAAIEGVLYPPRLSMEQCSSEQTARYKAAVAVRLCGSAAQTMVDLTGGFGVDFSFMARGFNAAVYVERQPYLCEVVRHNLPLLQVQGASVVCGDGVAYLHDAPACDFFYIDPARRDAHGGKTVLMADCVPHVPELLSALRSRSRYTLVKLSPMLDWHQAVAELNAVAGEPVVTEVHVVAVKNECKELLLVIRGCNEPEAGLQVYCVNGDDVFAYPLDAESALPQRIRQQEMQPGQYLYEPHAAVMKAGCYGLLTRRWPVAAVAANSHLFVSEARLPDFPGRRFRIDAVSGLNKTQLKKVLYGVSKASVTVRNFPMTAAGLRKRLKLKDGGWHYLFATTDWQGHHRLIVGQKTF